MIDFTNVRSGIVGEGDVGCAWAGLGEGVVLAGAHDFDIKSEIAAVGGGIEKVDGNGVASLVEEGPGVEDELLFEGSLGASAGGSVIDSGIFIGIETATFNFDSVDPNHETIVGGEVEEKLGRDFAGSDGESIAEKDAVEVLKM